MIKKVGGKSIITSDKKEIEGAKKILLPGVGAFDDAVKNLKKLGFWELIKEKVLVEKVPIMGICLGMQLLTKGSEEGDLSGFCFIDAYAKKFKFKNNNLKTPHMGWNTVFLQKKSKIFCGVEGQESRFYFVHSFAVECYEKRDVLMSTDYEYNFTSGFEKENIIGCQFHPEKSHKFGMILFKNFVENY